MSLCFCYYKMRHCAFRNIWVAKTYYILASDVTEAKMHLLNQFKEENEDGLDRTLEWVKMALCAPALN